MSRVATYLCEGCRAALESRTVNFGTSSAARFHCPRCQTSYTQQQLCDVCRLGRTSFVLGTVAYRSSILGSHQVRHCPTCRPPSKMSLEFASAPGEALVKYGLIYGVPALCLLLLLIGLISGSGSH